MKTFTYTIQDMGMGVKCGDTVTVSVDGADEETAFAEMQAFFQQNL